METVHVSFYPKTIQIAAVTTRLWNKDFIRILQGSYKPMLSACFPLKTVGSNIFLNLTVLPFNKKTTRFPVTMALVQEVHNRVHNICLQHVIRGRSALGETLWRLTQFGRRAPFLAPSAPAHIQSASCILPRRSTLIGYEPKLNDSDLFTFLVNAINVGSALHKLSLCDGHDLVMSRFFSGYFRVGRESVIIFH